MSKPKKSSGFCHCDRVRCFSVLKQVCNLLHRILTPKPNFSKKKVQAIYVLRNNSTIIDVLPTDNVNAIVVLDTDTYKERISETLQSW